MKELISSLKNIKKATLIVVMSIMSCSGMAQWKLVMQYGGNIYSHIETGGVMYVGTQFGVYKSNNNGVNWSIANTGLTNTVVRPMIANNARLFAGTEAGVFISDNQGVSWVGSGLTISKINCLFNATEGIYAGTNGQGLFFTSINH